MKQAIETREFIKTVVICTLASYGGPEAHYGVFSKEMVEKKKYISQEELTELIGIFSLLPGPSSTQTITAIGYRVGGPIIALTTLGIWIMPALFTMSLLGIILDWLTYHQQWQSLLTFLPATAIAFITYAAIQLTRKVIHSKNDGLEYLLFCCLAFLFIPWSVWMVLALLLFGGFLRILPNLFKVRDEMKQVTTHSKPKWFLVGIILLLAVSFESATFFWGGNVSLFSSIYRYGYSIIGGGQVMIPLMIQDLVNGQHFLNQVDFLAGYTLDQAVPGPLFSFAAFVTSRSLTGSPFLILFLGMVGGALIFLPGTLLVFFATPLWQEYRNLHYVRHFLKGVSIVVAAIITWTAFKQMPLLNDSLSMWLVFLASLAFLFYKKIPAPFIVMASLLLGLLWG